MITMRGIVVVLLATCAVARAQSGDGDGTTIQDDLIIACPLEEPPDALVTILRHPTDCSKFYKCANGLPVEIKCPNGTLFNDQLKVCDWPRNVDCDGTASTEEVNAPSPAPTKPPTTTTTTEKPATPSVSCPAEDPQDGEAVILPNPEDPTSFFICSWGVAYLQKCPPGLYFNSKLRVCDWPENVVAGPTAEPAPKPTEDENTLPPAPAPSTEEPASPSVSCPAEDPQDGEAVILPNPDDPSSFFVCSGGRPILKNCPAGLYFNSNLKVCDWPENVAEKPTTAEPAPKPTEDENTLPPAPAPSTEKPASPSVSCPAEDPQDGEAVILPNPDDPSSFFICSWGVPYLQNCPAGLLFNSKLKVCDWPENVVAAPTPEPAPKPTEDENTLPPAPAPSTEEPVSPSVSCPAEDPQDGEAVILPNPDDPSSFFVCSGGRPILKNCPAGLYFNSNLKVCDWPENVVAAPTAEPAPKPTEDENTLPPAPAPSTEKPASPSVSCPAEDPQDGEAVILPNPDDPSSFFICSWGVPYRQNCSAGLHFNSELKVCDWS